MEQGLHIRLLGPVSVRTEGAAIAVPSRPQRIVLAVLALEAGRVVTSARLIDALWPEDPPPNATGNLHSYVSKLRRVVGPDRIRRQHGGYLLAIDTDAVDALRVKQLADALTTDDPQTLVALLGDALALWRGEPLADLQDVDALIPERIRLMTLRRELNTRRLAALVDAGDHATALPDLWEAAAQDPQDESVVALLVRALHGRGRTAEALRTISDFRRRIIDESGLEPSAALTNIEQAILLATPNPDSSDTRQSEPTQHAGAVPATAQWPRFTTPLHGRDDELARLDELVDHQRLVTVAGPGGIGKSRVVYELADRRRADGQTVHFLGLAALNPDDDLTARLAAALGLQVQAGVDPLAAVHQRIGSGGQLLVLDNCEHILDAVRQHVERLLALRSDLTVLTTSRSPLRLTEECVLRLSSLDEVGDAGRDLFVECVRRVRPQFQLAPGDEELVRAVVRGLGGLPLAIELGAGRMASMSLADLAARIDDLDLLAGGQPTERHRTLRSAIDWSYRLLSAAQRRLLRTISVFPAGTDLATVEDIARHLDLPGHGTAEVVALADASLIDIDLDRSARYTMLEPVRAFAGEHLEEAGERPRAQRILAEWARRTAAWIETTDRSPDEAAADARLRSDLLNLRVAHRTALQEGDLDTAIAISGPLARPATARNLPEIWSWALDLASHPLLLDHPERADALGAAATAAWLTGDLAGAERLASDGLAYDPSSVLCLQAVASVRLFLGDPRGALDLWLAASEPHGAYLPQAALAAVYTGDPDLARRSLADADTWAQEVAAPTEIALCRYAWGELLGPASEAVLEYEDAIALAAGVGSTFVVSISRVGLASTLAANDNYRRAIDEFDLVIRYWRTTGNWTQQWTTLRNVADLFDQLDRNATAERIRMAAAQAPAATPDPAGSVPHPLHDDPASRSTRTPDGLVALVLSELIEARRELPGG